MGTELNVCFFGDSFVAGLGDETGLGWVGRTVAESHRSGLPLSSYNLGVCGDTAEQVAARFAAEFTARHWAGIDNRAVLAFGANDSMLHGKRRRASSAKTLAALEQIRTATDAPLFLIGPPAVHDDDHNQRIGELSGAFADQCYQLGVGYLDSYSLTAKDELWRAAVADTDGYHPSSIGYQRLARYLTPALLQWFRSSPGV